LEASFDRFNYAIHKEKEMVSFRRFALALAVLALFVGMASAQTGGVGNNTTLQCQTNVTVTPTLRGEGLTEQTGDITISCTGGTPMTIGATIPLVNITVFYNSTVTSRLLQANGTNASEALLIVDEAGASTTSGFGPTLTQKLCSNPLAGCLLYAANDPSGMLQTPSLVSLPVQSIAAGATSQGTNIYQGVVNGNSVTFFGIPALPPTTTGTRVYRITNVRVNATTLAGGSSSGATAVQASISISGATSLLISQSQLNVGFVQTSLNANATGALTNLQQCTSRSLSSGAVALLSFTENFGTAFKTRVVPSANTLYSGQRQDPPAQNVPGTIYNSESNFVFPITTAQTAGLADYGTRLKAVFSNIPSTVNLYVSVQNVQNGSLALASAPSPVGNQSQQSYAQLVSSDTGSDGNAGYQGFFPVVLATANAATLGSSPTVAQVSLTAGTGTAVWEVINTNPNTNETLVFAVYATYTANVSQSQPTIGTSTVNLSYGPNATSGAASSTLPEPRFLPDAAAARTLFTIVLCRTILLYPYITNQAGFDTGLTIANTSADPFTVGTNVTPTQAGSCTFTYYGGTTTAPTTPPAPTSTGNIAAGTVWAGLASTIVPAFQGYAWAVCNFQYAHGFAFISDLGARNLAMGYLAVVITDPGTSTRSATNVTTSENGGH